MSGSDYEALSGGGGAAEAAGDARRTWVRRGAAALVLALGVAGIVALAKSGGDKHDDPAPAPASWAPPAAYEVRVKMTLPYSGLVEDAYVQVDRNKGAQRVSYYGGNNVYIFNETGMSYSLVPVIDRQRCFSDPGGDNKGTPLQDVFPKKVGQTFKLTNAADEVAGEPCHVFEYNYTGPLADAEGLVGSYKFFVSKRTNHPVRLHFIGHNVFLGGSHVDEYVLDYSDFQDLSAIGGVSSVWFQPPRGMKCPNSREISPEEQASEAEQNERRIAELHDYDQHLLFPSDETEDAKDKIFDLHKARHNRSYTDAEHRFRRSVYHANRRHVLARNRQMLGYFLEANHMADWTEDELAALRGARPSNETLCHTDTVARIAKQREGVSIPNAKDYRVSPELVLPPGDQGSCGSCWTFGATGAMEAAFAKATGILEPLSKQNLLDCSWNLPFNDKACNGGTDYKGYEWVINNNRGRVATAASYSYTNQAGFCHFDASRGLNDETVEAGKARVTDCFVVTERYLNESAVTTKEGVDAFVFKLATEGPLAISINATPKDFYFYRAGIYSSSECKGDNLSLDHSVLAVGYNIEEGYMIMRNSWSSHWGEDGYARLHLDSNTCGFATVPTYVHAEAL